MESLSPAISSRDIIGHMIPDSQFPIDHFLLVVLWNQAPISNGFRDIKRWIWRNGSHDLKRPLNRGQGHLCLACDSI